ncbi:MULTISPECIES: CCC motif membrane protein [Altibacter]|uniref:CCC motif membrane protein n=1 Tax=Altibacter TaxID=1535231 RepID=UPI0005542BBF|nr:MULTISPECIES: CCC motif membrane protein [Altibacter]MCW8980438.1 CCC motif membrane protein [Altibacter sp.]MCW9036392.1 CCC motif membrane protein [Altibacter sp.]
MEKQKLPNATLILVFGIVSIVTCCCYGVLGLIFGIIAIVMAKKATAVYMANPEQYTGYQNVKTGKILAIIGIVLNAIYLGYVIFLFATLGMDGIMNMNQEIMEQYGM